VKWADQQEGRGRQVRTESAPRGCAVPGHTSFSEPDWDGVYPARQGNGLERVQAFYQGREKGNPRQRRCSAPGRHVLRHDQVDRPSPCTRSPAKVAVLCRGHHPAREESSRPTSAPATWSAAAKERESGQHLSKGSDWYKANHDNRSGSRWRRSSAEDALLWPPPRCTPRAQACKGKNQGDKTKA